MHAADARAARSRLGSRDALFLGSRARVGTTHLHRGARPLLHNANGRLHRPDGPAVEWPSGSSYWFWEGLHGPKRVAAQASERARVQVLVRTRNLELRRILLDRAGRRERFQAAPPARDRLDVRLSTTRASICSQPKADRVSRPPPERAHANRRCCGGVAASDIERSAVRRSVDGLIPSRRPLWVKRERGRRATVDLASVRIRSDPGRSHVLPLPAGLGDQGRPVASGHGAGGSRDRVTT